MASYPNWLSRINVKALGSIFDVGRKVKGSEFLVAHRREDVVDELEGQTRAFGG